MTAVTKFTGLHANVNAFTDPVLEKPYD